MGALVACLAVVGCGQATGKATAPKRTPTAAAAVGDPTPKIGVDGATVSLQHGAFDPSTIHGLVRNGFLLTIHGDGHAHTIAVPTLVVKTPVQAPPEKDDRGTSPRSVGRVSTRSAAPA